MRQKCEETEIKLEQSQQELEKLRQQLEDAKKECQHNVDCYKEAMRRCHFFEKENKEQRQQVEALKKDKSKLSTQLFKANEILFQVTKLSTGQDASAHQCGVVLMAMDYFDEQRTAIDAAIEKERGV